MRGGPKGVFLMTFTTRFAGASIAACTLLTVPAFAEEASDHGKHTIIVVGHHTIEDAQAEASATPGGTDVVTYDDYADRSAVSLRDTLAFSPGVYTQPRFGQEVRLSIRGSGLSRGFHMRGLTLLQDGVPINLSDDNGDFQELDPIFFDHLQVYRGANALRFGSGTLGGAINAMTPNGGEVSGVRLRGEVGSFEMLRGLVTVGGASGPVDFWTGISADSANGDRNHADRSSVRFHGNAGFRFSDVLTTRFYVSLNDIKQKLPGALTRSVALTAPETANAGSVSGDQARDIKSIRLQNRTRFDWGATTFEIAVFANIKDLYHPIFQVIDQGSDDVGALARLEGEAGPVSFTLGGEIRRGNTRARQFLNVSGSRGARTFEAEQDARTANIYGEIRFKPTEQLTLVAGGIYADGFRKRRVMFSGQPDGRISFNEFSPKFGALYEPTETIQFFANYSRSAEFPGFGEVFQTVNGVPRFVASIAPQTAWTFEIGTRGSLGIASWDVALYRADLEGEMLQFTPDSSIPAGTFNADRTRHQGVEAALSLEPTDWLRFRQIWQYSDFTFRNDAQFGSNRLPVIPQHVLRTEIRLGTDALHVSPNLEWIPQGPWSDYANTTRTPGYALIGLSAGATVREGIDIFVDARNLTDKNAIGDVSAVLTATPASAIYYPVERRSVYGGVRVRF